MDGCTLDQMRVKTTENQVKVKALTHGMVMACITYAYFVWHLWAHSKGTYYNLFCLGSTSKSDLEIGPFF